MEFQYGVAWSVTIHQQKCPSIARTYTGLQELKRLDKTVIGDSKSPEWSIETQDLNKFTIKLLL